MQISAARRDTRRMSLIYTRPSERALEIYEAAELAGAEEEQKYQREPREIQRRGGAN